MALKQFHSVENKENISPNFQKFYERAKPQAAVFKSQEDLLNQVQTLEHKLSVVKEKKNKEIEMKTLKSLEREDMLEFQIEELSRKNQQLEQKLHEQMFASHQLETFYETA